MAWEKTIPVNDLPDGGRKVVTVDNKPVLLINHCEKVYAISSTCPHWGLPLELGRLTDDCGIICPWHRSGFDLDTGDVKAWAPWPPGLGLVLGATSRKKVLPTYATKVEADSIWVNLDSEAVGTASAPKVVSEPAAQPPKPEKPAEVSDAVTPSAPPSETSETSTGSAPASGVSES
jgi:nitrite reductase/ring-hydroxylating ferredoxin subunit